MPIAALDINNLSFTSRLSMDISEVLNNNVSFQAAAWKNISKELKIRVILDEIKNGKYADQIQRLRALLENGHFDKYSSHKKNLPAVTFCGTFDHKRRKEFLNNYTYLTVLDIDKINKADFDNAKNSIDNDPYVLASWISPSGNGIKGLVKLEYYKELPKGLIDDFHKTAFLRLSEYFKSEYGIKLDESGSDTTRLCFLSFDPKLSLNTNCIPFRIENITLPLLIKTETTRIPKKLTNKNPKDLLFNPTGKNNPQYRALIQSMIKFLVKRNISITYSYEEWYRVAYALANTFTYELAEKYFLKLSQIDEDKYDENNCKNMLANCYENNKGKISFSTIIFYTKNKGFVIRDKAGQY